MPKFSFHPDELKRVLSLAKMVKPETGDLCFKFEADMLTIFSFNRRSHICARVRAITGSYLDPEFKSNDHYVTLDRTALFDSDLTEVTISVNDQSMSITATDGGQTRHASLKRRSIRSKRPEVPKTPDNDSITISAKDFESLLFQVSCSALVKETKTDEEMRMNQVHFYSDSNCAYSSARYYSSIVFLKDFNLDLSIVSSDIPLMKLFCSRIGSDNVNISYDDHKIYLVESKTGSFLALSRVVANKPQFSVLDKSGFQTMLTVDQEQLLKNLGWAQLAIEGTQRMNFTSLNNNSDICDIIISNESSEISRFPANFVKGDSIKADFPVRFFHSIVKHIYGKICLGFNHIDAPTVLGIFPFEQPEDIEYFHYLQSMRMR